MEKDNFNIHIFTVFMEKVFEEMRNWLICDVATNHNVPIIYIHLWLL